MMCAVRPRPRSRRHPKPDRRRALELLAGCGVEGCTEAILYAQRLTVDRWRQAP